jgi:hypothetical protein
MSSIWSFLGTIVSRSALLASAVLLAVAFLAVAQAGASAHQAHGKPAMETSAVERGVSPASASGSIFERLDNALAAAHEDHGGKQHHGRANGFACCDVLAGGCTPLGFGAADSAPNPAFAAAQVSSCPSAAARIRFPEIELPPPR